MRPIALPLTNGSDSWSKNTSNRGSRQSFEFFRTSSVNSNSCRDEARTSLLRAVEMPIGRDRSLLECRAAAWSMRADQLQRQEERSAAYLSYSLAEREAEHVRL